MPKQINIGVQDFKKVIENDYFYVDKTEFIREWWQNADDVTLIARPRRFGKALNMSMLDRFFSNKYVDERSLFEGLKISEDASMMALQGKFPVINFSFSSIKENTYRNAMERIKVNLLSGYLCRFYGKKVVILLDEYDTPLQEAYVNGYWDEMAAFVRGFFNATLKANKYLERALLTGITRVSKESIFSDLNNLAIMTTSSKPYADCFGFTQKEVDQALEDYGLKDRREEVKKWYDGFVTAFLQSKTVLIVQGV